MDLRVLCPTNFLEGPVPQKKGTSCAAPPRRSTPPPPLPPLAILAQKAFAAPLAPAPTTCRQTVAPTAVTAGAVMVVGTADGRGAALVKVGPAAGTSASSASASAAAPNTAEVLIGDLFAAIDDEISRRKGVVSPRHQQQQENAESSARPAVDRFRVCVGGADVLLPSASDHSESIPTPTAPTPSVAWGIATSVSRQQSAANAAPLSPLSYVSSSPSPSAATTAAAVGPSASALRVLTMIVVRYIAGDAKCTVAVVEHYLNHHSSSSSSSAAVPATRIVSVSECDLAADVPSSAADTNSNNNNNNAGVFKVTDIASADGKFHVAVSVARDDDPPEPEGENDDDVDGDGYDEDNNSGNNSGKANASMQQKGAAKSAFVCAVAIGTTTVVEETSAPKVAGGGGGGGNAALAALGLGGNNSNKAADSGAIAFGSRKQRERQQAELEAAAEKQKGSAVRCFELAMMTGVCYITMAEDTTEETHTNINSAACSVSLSCAAAPASFARLVVPVDALAGGCADSSCGAAAVSRAAAAAKCVTNTCGGIGGGGSFLAIPATPRWAISCTAPMTVGSSSSLWSFDVLAAVADLPHSAQCSASSSSSQPVALVAKGIAAPGVVGRIAVVFNRQTHFATKRAVRAAERLRRANGSSSNSSNNNRQQQKAIVDNTSRVFADNESLSAALMVKSANANELAAAAAPIILACPIDAVERVPIISTFDNKSYMHEQNAPHYYGAAFGAPASAPTLAGGGTETTNTITAGGASTVAKSFFATPISALPCNSGSSNNLGTAATMTTEVASYVALFGEEGSERNIARRAKREAMLSARQQLLRGGNGGGGGFFAGGAGSTAEDDPSPFAAPSAAAEGRRIVFSPDRQLAAEPLRAIITVPLGPYTVSTAAAADGSVPSVLTPTPSMPPAALLLLILPSCLLLVDPRFGHGRCVIGALRCPIPTCGGGFSGGGWAEALDERDGAALLLSMGADSKGTSGGMVSSKSRGAWEVLTGAKGAMGGGGGVGIGGGAAGGSSSAAAFTSGSAQRTAAAIATAAASALSAKTNTTMVVGSIIAAGGGLGATSSSGGANNNTGLGGGRGAPLVLDPEGGSLVSFLIAVDPSPEMGGAVAVTRFEVTSVTHNGVRQIVGEGQQTNTEADTTTKTAEIENNTKRSTSPPPATTTPAAAATLFTAVTHAPTTPSLARALDAAMVRGGKKGGEATTSVSSTEVSSSLQAHQHHHQHIKSAKLNRSAEPTTALIAVATSDGIVRLTDLATPASSSSSPSSSSSQGEGIVIGFFDELIGGNRKGTSSQSRAPQTPDGQWSIEPETLTQLFVSVESSAYASSSSAYSSVGGPSSSSLVAAADGSRHAVAATVTCCLGFSSGLVKIFESRLLDPQPVVSASFTAFGATTTTASSSNSPATHTAGHLPPPTPVLKYERYLHNSAVTGFFNVNQIEKHWHLAALHQQQQSSAAGSAAANGSGFASPSVMSPAVASPTTTGGDKGFPLGSPDGDGPLGGRASTGAASSSQALCPSASFLASLEFQIVSVSAPAGTVCLHRKADYHRYALLHGSFASSSEAAADPLTGVFFDAESEYALVTTASGKGYLWQVVTGLLERVYKSPSDYINALDASSNLLALAPAVAGEQPTERMGGNRGKDGSSSAAAAQPGSTAAAFYGADSSGYGNGNGGNSGAVNSANTGDAALALLPVAAYFDPIARRSVLSLSTVRLTEMLRKEVIANANYSTYCGGGQGGGLASPASPSSSSASTASLAATPLGFSPTVLRGATVLLESLGRLHRRSFGPAAANSSAVEAPFKADIAALADYFGLNASNYLSGSGDQDTHNGGPSNSNSGGPKAAAAIATEVLFAVTVLRALTNTNQATAASLAAKLATATSASASASSTFSTSPSSAVLTLRSGSLSPAAAAVSGGQQRVDLVAARLLLTVMTALPWAVPRGCHGSGATSAAVSECSEQCHKEQCRNVIAVIREMVPLLIAAAAPSGGGASGRAAAAAAAAAASVGVGGGAAGSFYHYQQQLQQQQQMAGGGGAASLAAGAEAVIASAVAHVANGPWCLYCRQNNANATANSSSLSLSEAFAAMLHDPSECRPPIVYTIASSATESTAAAASSSNGPTPAAGTDAAKRPLNVSPPPQLLATSAAAGGVALADSNGGGSAASSVSPTYVDQSAYLLLLGAIATSLAAPRNDKQRAMAAELAKDLEAKIPAYLKLAVAGGFGFGGGVPSTTATVPSSALTSPVAAAVAGTSTGAGGGRPRASSQTPLPVPTAASSAGSIAILATVLKLVASRWGAVRGRLAAPDALLKQILVYGVLRDATVSSIRSASISALATAFTQQLRAGTESGGRSSSNGSGANNSSVALWEMLRVWFSTSVSAFHPDYAWRGGGGESAGSSTSSSSGAHLSSHHNNSNNSPAAAAMSVKSKDASDTHRFMLIHLFTRMIQMSPSDVILNDGMLKMLPLVFVAIDPHSPSRTEREACFSAVASLFRAAVRCLPNVSFQQKFQRIAVGHNSGAVTVFDVKSTDEICNFVAFEPSTTAGGRATATTPNSSKSKREKASSASAAISALPLYSAECPPPPHAVAAIAYSNLHHDVAVLPWDLSCVRIYHASGTGTFFLPSNHSTFKLRREVPLPPPPHPTAGSSAGASVSSVSAAFAAAEPLSAAEVAERCSLVWLSPQCVEVTSPWHDRVQATI